MKCIRKFYDDNQVVRVRDDKANRLVKDGKAEYYPKRDESNPGQPNTRRSWVRYE